MSRVAPIGAVVIRKVTEAAAPRPRRSHIIPTRWGNAEGQRRRVGDREWHEIRKNLREVVTPKTRLHRHLRSLFPSFSLVARVCSVGHCEVNCEAQAKGEDSIWDEQLFGDEVIFLAMILRLD